MAIKNPLCKDGSYSEEYDMEALRELATMAARFVINEDYGDMLKVKGTSVPDGMFSDFSCCVWELCLAMIRYGAKLERMSGIHDRFGFLNDDAMFFLRHPIYFENIDLEQKIDEEKRRNC